MGPVALAWLGCWTSSFSPYIIFDVLVYQEIRHGDLRYYHVPVIPGRHQIVLFNYTIGVFRLKQYARKIIHRQAIRAMINRFT